MTYTDEDSSIDTNEGNNGKTVVRNASSSRRKKGRNVSFKDSSSFSRISPERSVSHSSYSSSAVSSIDDSDRIDTASGGLSVAKTLTLLRSQPPNRSCADCRSALIDPSTVYASLCLDGSTDTKSDRLNRRQHSVRKIALQDFHLTHSAFAPPSNADIPAFEAITNGSNENDVTVRHDSNDINRNNRNSHNDDPAFSINERFGGHGVFLCGRCAEAHRLLGSLVKVKRVTDTTVWTIEEAQFIVTNGGNAHCWKIYEAFVPDQWKERRPIYSSSLSARILFCRAKYEALAFCLPQPGARAKNAWKNILQNHQDRDNRTPGTPYLKNISILSLEASLNHTRKKSSPSSSTKRKETGPPNRLIDYFCVVSSSMQLLPSKFGKKKKQRKVKYSQISSPEGLDFWPHLTDCYPPKNTHGEMGYEDHISSFVMPGGCHPTLDPKPPTFSTFVLTMADGSFLYGGSLQIYDEHMDAEEIKRAMRDSGFEGEFPGFLMDDDKMTRMRNSDVFFFPKCLVILSRYAFFNLFRNVLLEIYQISLLAAPLPIERYISNFVCEIPLPPRGQVKVEFSFTIDRKFTVERPPINKLPMADFSYRPLFASLSVSNIIVVLGYLLQECKVVLLTEHYSMLTPVAEALLSAIFPFRWVGLYIPVAPLKMIDILDAPIPYLIGLHSDYFKVVDVRHRPNDAILVDLDRDVIHIGQIPLPEIPEHDAQKLMTSLEEAGGSAYVIPNSGIKGCIMAGTKKSILLHNQDRPRFAHMTTMTGLEINSFFRDELFNTCDLAYGGSDDKAERINGFGSISGRMASMAESNRTNEKNKSKPFIVSPIKKPKIVRRKKANILSRSQAAKSQTHLLDMAEPEGFSVDGIRNAFLRFTVATFADYQNSLLDSSRHFDGDKFIEDFKSSERSMQFLQNILRSQLFQRFLEQRKENPDLPEIRFFDESIIAKRNRSKREKFSKGGKKTPTPFLDDTSTWEVKKIFTPPPPNNLGLPDSAATYRYGIFPILDAARFGRIRPPITWHQQTSLDSVMNSNKFDSKIRKSQIEIVKNALKPVFDTPIKIAAVAKHTARDLESTLAALSIAPSTKQSLKANETSSGDAMLTSSHRNVKTLSTADTIMMDARRKQGILLDVIIRIQALCRGFLTRNNFFESRYEILESRRSEEMAERKRILMLRAIIGIQTAYRSFSNRKRWNRVKDGAIVIAKVVRARRARVIFHELRRMITNVQSRVRGVLVRTKIKFVIEQKMDIYTTQIFVLWTYLNVPLILRTKLWPDISGNTIFLGLRLAEVELVRLWGIASLFDHWNGVKHVDKISLYCDSIGMSNEIYYRSKACADWLQRDASIIAKHDTALRLEETERLQIYERLNSTVSEKDLSSLYNTFDIVPDAKLKKAVLSETLWTKIFQADRSTTVMNFLFPELKNSLSISFLKPSSKGQRRFPKALNQPVPPIDHDLWHEISNEERTKRHVKEVAMLFITKVPQLSEKLDYRQASKISNFDTFLRAVMEAKGFKSAEHARVFIIHEYIHSNC